MLLRPDSLGAHDLLTDAVMVLLGESGASGLSLRKLAEHRGVSVGALTGRWGSRGRMLHVAVNTFRARWLLQTSGRSWYDGVRGLLPYVPEDIEDCRVWAGFVELAHTDTVVAECVDAHRVDERQLVASLTRARLDELGLDAVLAEVEGLRQALVAPTPLTIDRSCAALRTVEERFGISPAELDLTGPPAWLYPTG